MNVLLIGTDRSLFNPASDSGRRHAAYGAHFDEMNIIVFTQAAQSLGARDLQVGVHVHPTASRNRFTYGFGALRIARRLPKPDVISAQDPFETGLVAWVIAKRYGAPLHIQIHTDFLAPAFVRGSFLNRVRRMIAGFVLRRAARVRVVSEGVKEGVQKRYALLQPITVLPIFVDIEKYAGLPRIKHTRFKVALLAVGRLEGEKQMTRAIDALKAAREAGHDAGLIIVGSGSEEARLRAYAREKGLERFVEFPGWQRDVRPHLSVADLLLVTSDYEGYGMVIIEALAAGVPVLSTDVGIAREAGAMVASAETFGATLVQWLTSGPRKGMLASYPYENAEAYVQAWCDDVQAAAQKKQVNQRQ